jgi:DNA-binding NarL/FixJ family response regulator
MHLPRLLLADDHTETRKLLRCILEQEFDVVGDVPDGLALVSAARQLSPDVIVTDISMPGVNGIVAAVTILRHDPGARIVFITVDADTALVDRGLSIGALGYVLKLTADDELVPAVRAALGGRHYVSRTLQRPAPRLACGEFGPH